MFIRPTKAEYKQYEELKKKIANYEQSKIKMRDMLEDLLRDVKDAIFQDRDVSIEITPVPASIDVSECTYKTKIVITVGG